MTVQACAPGVGRLADAQGRVQNYLRLSVTDRCNFRCVYCVPPEGVTLCRPRDLLSFDEIEEAVGLLAELGVSKVRLTGGEPLLRARLPELVARLRRIPGIRTLALTTNGDRLESLARPLRDAGLDQINVSLDSLDPDRFRRVTGGGDLGRTRAGIVRTLDCGVPVKINCVVLSDLDFAEVARFVALAGSLPIAVRFIEFMPLCGERWNPRSFVPLAGLERRIRERWRAVPCGTDGVARRFKAPGWSGEIGFIATLGDPFCATCSRLRLTARGVLHTCLFQARGADLAPLLRSGDREGLARAVREAVRGKPRMHGGDAPLTDASPPPDARIRLVGG